MLSFWGKLELMIQTCSGKPLEVIETGNKLPEGNVILLLRTLFQKTLEDLTKELRHVQVSKTKEP